VPLVGADCRTWSCGRLLFDAAVTGSYGGTGKRVSSDAALEAGRLVRAAGKEFFLAGGIGPANVAEAIRELGPDGIDVGSGVEEAPGRKSEKALEALFMALAAIDDGKERQHVQA
jgi:phosphoribosylanthranilate isomerase